MESAISRPLPHFTHKLRSITFPGEDMHFLDRMAKRIGCKYDDLANGIVFVAIGQRNGSRAQPLIEKVEARMNDDELGAWKDLARRTNIALEKNILGLSDECAPGECVHGIPKPGTPPIGETNLEILGYRFKVDPEVLAPVAEASSEANVPLADVIVAAVKIMLLQVRINARQTTKGRIWRRARKVAYIGGTEIDSRDELRPALAVLRRPGIQLAAALVFQEMNRPDGPNSPTCQRLMDALCDDPWFDALLGESMVLTGNAHLATRPGRHGLQELEQIRENL